jgi:hypothetical protein
LPSSASAFGHPFLLAQSWRQQMEHDAKLNKARIAAREGISRAHVTQVMNLLQLPAEIQAGLLTPPAPLESIPSAKGVCGCWSPEGTKKPKRPAGGNLSRNSRILAAIEPRLAVLWTFVGIGNGAFALHILVDLVHKLRKKAVPGASLPCEPGAAASDVGAWCSCSARAVAVARRAAPGVSTGGISAQQRPGEARVLANESCLRGFREIS